MIGLNFTWGTIQNNDPKLLHVPSMLSWKIKKLNFRIPFVTMVGKMTLPLGPGIASFNWTGYKPKLYCF